MSRSQKGLDVKHQLSLVTLHHIYLLYNYRVLIEDVQVAVDAQVDNEASPRAHSYTKYNTWGTVRGRNITVPESSSPDRCSASYLSSP